MVTLQMSWIIWTTVQTPDIFSLLSSNLHIRETSTAHFFCVFAQQALRSGAPTYTGTIYALVSSFIHSPKSLCIQFRAATNHYFHYRLICQLFSRLNDYMFGDVLLHCHRRLKEIFTFERLKATNQLIVAAAQHRTQVVLYWVIEGLKAACMNTTHTHIKLTKS